MQPVYGADVIRVSPYINLKLTVWDKQSKKKSEPGLGQTSPLVSCLNFNQEAQDPAMPAVSSHLGPLYLLFPLPHKHFPQVAF